MGRGVLIPRPDTETLVDEALSLLGGNASPTVADLCAGSGCIGIAIAPYTSAVINTDTSLVIRHLEDLNFSPRVCLIWNQNKKLFSEINAFINLF